MPYATADDGTRLFYKDLGDGPTILLLHSWALHSGMWEYQIHALREAGYRIVAPDRRGHGRSDWAGTGYDFGTLIADITSVLDHAGVEEHAVLAHSTGGIEAVRLAAHRPGVRAMVLVAPIGPDMDGIVGRPVLDNALDGLRRDRPQYFRTLAEDYFARPESGASDALLEEAMTGILMTPLEVCTTLMASAWTTDVSAEAAALAMPVLILHGDTDESAPLPVTGQRYADLIPAASLTVYSGAPHGLYATHQDQINRDATTFLDQHMAATRAAVM